MKPIVQSLAEYLESLGDSSYSVTGSPNQFRIAFPEGETLITVDGTVKEHLRMPRPVVPAGGPFVTKVKRSDYGLVSELLELTHSIPLDLSASYEPNERGIYPNTVHLGVLDLYFGGVVGGGFITDAAPYLDEEQKQEWLASRVELSEDESGNPLVVLKYHPKLPVDLTGREDIYKYTRLSEVMTFEEFETELDAEAAWTEDLFTHGDDYELNFEIVLAGDDPTKPDGWNELLTDPLWLHHDGEVYNIYVWNRTE